MLSKSPERAASYFAKVNPLCGSSMKDVTTITCRVIEADWILIYKVLDDELRLREPNPLRFVLKWREQMLLRTALRMLLPEFPTSAVVAELGN